MVGVVTSCALKSGRFYRGYDALRFFADFFPTVIDQPGLPDFC
jgi:hypothetical protein